VEVRSNPMPGGGFVTLYSDLTERRAFEAKRRQAQKMEVLGQLTGGSGPLSLNGAGTQIRQRELRWLAGAADRAGTALRAPLPHRVISRWWPQLERSDHGPFTRRGIRAVHLYHRGQDGEHIDLAYHSARDTLDRVDRGAVDELGRLLRALAASPPPAPAGGDGGGTDGFWLPVAINTVVPRWAAIGLLLPSTKNCIVPTSTPS
jgi:hypothetical protein